MLAALPHHAISRLVGAATRWRWAPWKNGLIRWFISRYGVDMSEALETAPEHYEHFNAFFTRALKHDARPLPPAPEAVLCPADGYISALGPIREGRTLIQAKGHAYDVGELLGDQAEAAAFERGRYTTVYLSPSDYHRVHMPVAGSLRRMIHVPGRLFSVQPATVRSVPNLFARNERVVCLFDTAHGPMALVLVGAINVASIETRWAGVITPPRGRAIRHWDYPPSEAPRFERGEEMGRFNMGSTAIVLFGEAQMEWDAGFKVEQKVRMGQRLGRLLEPADPA
ncbi:phosphatidylserine decarboxylase [Alkalilimnicola sp. S0819]|nr:phosphatidylserine decarboxylase [Alkalilimnicola sp. S0819]MPQ15472.1 phosphatidylserine decarboxylase [Alkalilimnicola sp. S0819]